MAVYDAEGNTLTAVYDADGISLSYAYDENGNVIFSKESPLPDVPVGLESYNVFVPQNVSNEWVASGNGKTLNVSSDEFLALFYDGYLTNPPTGLTVTKRSIGKDQSGLYDIYEYDFCPQDYERVILLSSGMHTYELSASFGLANFINNLYSTDNDSNEAFQYIRRYVRIKVIPIINPWGFNQSPKTYGNVNGVNPNRGFDVGDQWNEFPVNTPSQNEWNVKGEYPFSEKEVINLAKWASENWQADYWIDFHTGLGYSDADLWLYYSSDSKILSGINGAIDKIETWFASAYGTACVTKRTIDNADSIRLHWAEKALNLSGYTQEQAPARTTFGTSANNDSGDISVYSTEVSTFIQEFLLEKYIGTVVEIQSATNPSNISIDVSEGNYSATIESALTPLNTTRNKFLWTSSDNNVAKVYGGSNKAVVVGVGNGTATLTGTNRYNENVVVTCNVTVTGYALPNAITLASAIGALDPQDGSETVATNRVRTGFIDISSRNWENALTIRDLTLSGVGNEYLIRLYDNNHEYITTLSSSYWNGNKDSAWSVGNGALYDTATLPSVTYIRLVFRYADNRNVTSASGSFRILNTTYSFSTE